MFGAKKSSVSEEHLETIVGSNTVIYGAISASGGVKIDGQIEGDLISAASIYIGENGCVKAQIKAKNAVIAGTVRGAAEVIEKLELLPTAKLYGDIKVGSVVLYTKGQYLKALVICELKMKT